MPQNEIPTNEELLKVAKWLQEMQQEYGVKVTLEGGERNMLTFSAIRSLKKMKHAVSNEALAGANISIGYDFQQSVVRRLAKREKYAT